MKKLCSLCLLMLFPTVVLAASLDVDAAYKKGRASWDAGDIVGAMNSLKPAADAGHAAAQALYGLALDDADNDVEAESYYRRAAEQNDPDGMFGLAGFFISGDVGEINSAKALEQLVKAAGLGHAPSIFVLFDGYQVDSFGLGPAAKDSPESIQWARKASDLGYLAAMVRMEDLHRNGRLGVSTDIVAADALRTRIYKVQGIDPNAKVKKKRQRR